MKFAFVLITLLFGILSFQSLSQYYYLGDFEAATMLSKKPSVVDWDKFQSSPSKTLSSYVSDDSFHNFQTKEEVKLVENPMSKPSVYLKTQTRIYPFFMQTRTGAIPHFLNGALSQLATPGLSLILLPWICSMLCFFFASAYVHSTSGLTIPFALTALLTPHFSYFTGFAFPDCFFFASYLLLILVLIERGKNRKDFILIGFMTGLTVYTTLSTVMYAPFYLIFYPRKIFEHKRSIALGLIPWIFFMGYFFNLQDLSRVLSDEKDLMKPISFLAETAKQFFSFSISPIHVFNKVTSDIDLREGIFFWIAFASSFITSLYLLTFLDLKKSIRLLLLTIYYIIALSVIVQYMEEAMLSYFAIGLCILMTIAFGMAKPASSLQGFTRLKIVFATFLFAKFSLMLFYLNGLRNLSLSLDECSWTYQCIVDDWKKNDLIQDKPIITLFNMDVGQIEFFSRETILPVHVKWKYNREPSPREFLDFLTSLSSKEVYSLWSEGRDFSTFLKTDPNQTEKLLLARGIKLNIIKIYSFPEVDRSYKLVKFTLP